MSMQPAPTGDNEFGTRQSPSPSPSPIPCPANRLATTRGSRHRIMGLLFVHTIMSLMVVKVASTAALYQHQQQALQPLNDIESTAETSASDGETHNLSQGLNQSQRLSLSQSSSDIEKMRAKLQQLQHEQQQEYLRQQQQQQQLQLHLQQMHATGAVGETAYLLERADHAAPAPAPIYGTWRTKARRAPHATSGNDVDDGHVYERLPKRSATMTPLRGLLRDQMPRPPRLATQDTHQPQVSGSPPHPPTTALLRRHYSETPGTLAMREDKPKPFHFPYEGPMPEQFTKGEAEREQRPRSELNNIQDILQHLHLNGLAPSKLPPMVMMPTGLHIAGSFKNLKSSGIGNFFRGKRNKKQMQFSIPLPMSMGHMPMPMSMSMSMPMSMPMPMAMPMPIQWYGPGVMAHQRVAIDQLYPYKPRSPQDVNLLAMQQQLTPKKNASKKKNKKKLQQQQQQLAQSNHNLLLEHGSQQHYVADPFGQQHLSQQSLLALNATRQPHHKRIPFKLNLDIYPVMPPSRPTSMLRNPFQQEYAMPSPAALTGTTAAAYQHLGHGIYQAPFKFPTQTPHPGHMPINFPDQAPRFSQQQALYQSQGPKFPPPKSVHPDEAIYGHSPVYGQTQNTGQSNWQGHSQGYAQGQGLAHVQALGQVQAQGQGQTLESQTIESQTSPIMLHLNVFPKQKPTATIRASTNPFYNHNLHRNTINSNDLPPPNPPSPIEPRQAGNGSATPSAAHPQHHNQQQQQQQQPSQQISLNQTQQQQQQQPQVNRSSSISRSDHLPLIDFEHPIVAAEAPEAASLASFRTDHRHHRAQTHHHHHHNHPVDDHFRYQKSANIEQLAAEAQTASLFRFPVEDLIQFHVDDAL